MDFVVDIYETTNRFPSNEVYGLTSQIKRAAVSIPSNIAEGSGRKNPKEFIQFLFISKGSLAEVETQLEIAHRLKYLSDINELLNKAKRIRMMLIGLIDSFASKL
jgi:four helix bundle protein